VLDLRSGEPVFPVAIWGGYDRAAVEERVASLEDELADLRAQMDPEHGVEAEIQHLGDETADILRVAHGKADAMVKKAEADADRIVSEAREQAAEMVREAELRLQRLDRDTDLVWAERMRLTEDTRMLAQQLVEVADAAAERFPPEAPPAAEPLA
jgi:cell division septum initiation protein DivIVA